MQWKLKSNNYRLKKLWLKNVGGHRCVSCELHPKSQWSNSTPSHSDLNPRGDTTVFKLEISCTHRNWNYGRNPFSLPLVFNDNFFKSIIFQWITFLFSYPTQLRHFGELLSFCYLKKFTADMVDFFFHKKTTKY